MGPDDGLGPGLWEALITEDLQARLLGGPLEAEVTPLEDSEAADRLALHVATVVARSIEALPERQRAAQGCSSCGGLRDELLAVLSVLPGRITHLGDDAGFGADIPLRLHARYSRMEILSAFGVGSGVAPHSWQSGVLHVPDAAADLFAVTLDKRGRGFSPTTRYRDYALSRDLLHWESQSTTSAASATGQRYIHHAQQGHRIAIFVRVDGRSRAFWCLGPATYVDHSGDRPIGITWRLRHPLPADLYTSFAAAVA